MLIFYCRTTALTDTQYLSGSKHTAAICQLRRAVGNAELVSLLLQVPLQDLPNLSLLRQIYAEHVCRQTYSFFKRIPKLEIFLRILRQILQTSEL
jgi:hypothetical protein